MKPILSEVAARIPHDRGQDLMSIFECGEAPLALQMIIENLYEFEVVISIDESKFLYKLAADLGLEDNFLNMLGNVPVA